MNICVYCSAKDTIAEEYKQQGRIIGKWIAESGHTLVFGGATGGLMTEVSRSAFESGGQVIGVIPHRIIVSGRRSPWCTRIIKVAHMNERKQRMKELANCFICLPGSYGTLDEMFDVIAAGTVGEHHKPIYILNYNNFYLPLIQEIARMKQEKFIPAEESYIPVFVNETKQLISSIETHNPK